MRKNIVIVVLFMSVGMFPAYFAFGAGGYKSTNSKLDIYSIESLKEVEQRYSQRVKPSEKMVEQIELQNTVSLARQDASEFFRKDIPLNKPNLPISYLLTWSAFAFPDIMTFGFNDYKIRLSFASDYFTDDGWDSFMQYIDRSRIVEINEARQQLVVAAPKGAPVLESSGVVNGRYQWVVQMPLISTARSGSKTTTNSLRITALIVRTDDPKHPFGIAIKQWVAVSQ